MDNPIKTGEKMDTRDEKGRFIEGAKGNPLGRPKGSKNFTTKIKILLEKVSEGEFFSREEKLAEVIIEKALGGDASMIKLIWNYLDGNPPQFITTNLSETDETRDNILKLIELMTEKS